MLSFNSPINIAWASTILITGSKTSESCPGSRLSSAQKYWALHYTAASAAGPAPENSKYAGSATLSSRTTTAAFLWSKY